MCFGFGLKKQGSVSLVVSAQNSSAGPLKFTLLLDLLSADRPKKYAKHRLSTVPATGVPAKATNDSSPGQQLLQR